MLIYKTHSDNIEIIYAGKSHFINCKSNAHSPIFTPVLNKGGGLVAIPLNDSVIIYSFDSKTSVNVPKKPIRNGNSCAVFGNDGNLYFNGGKSVYRYNPSNNLTDVLYTSGHTFHDPSNIAVSTDGRYVSFTKYKSDNEYVNIIDTVDGSCIDTKFSVFRHMWIDETHIVHTKSGGLKVYDAETKKNTVLFSTVQKLIRCSHEKDKEILSNISLLSRDDYFINFDLLAISDSDIYFSLNIFCHKNDDLSHYGVWRYDVSSETVSFVFYIPQEFRRGTFRHFMHESELLCSIGDTLRVCDGKEIKTYSGFFPVKPYISVNT